MAFFGRPSLLFSACLLVAGHIARATTAFNMANNNNLAVYWGQNSYGASNSGNTGGYQKSLSYYCQDDAIDTFPIAFLNIFRSTGGLPEIDLANICSASTNGAFPGTSLANCQFLAADINACQAAGKTVTISLGGATGSFGFSNDDEAKTFAQTIWNLFLGGSSSIRPFGNAVLDGVDLDVEGGGTTGYAAFVRELRSLASGASKKYYVTGAPQCPFPDAYLGSVINVVGFDALYVQFYNNWCGLGNFDNVNAWNFGTWDDWAKKVSPNPDVKIYIGAPAAPSAAGSGYVAAATLGSIALESRAKYSSFGGVMLWDASQAYANGRFDQKIKSALGGGSSGAPGTTSNTPTSTSSWTSIPAGTSTQTTSTTSTTVATGNCASVSPWSSGIAYVGGRQVSYIGHLWTAKWWTQADTPGGPAGVWNDNGACGAAGERQGTATADSAPSAASETGASAESTGSTSKANSTVSRRAIGSSRFFTTGL